MTGPHIYRAISKVTEEFARSGIAKRHTNQDEKYQYRSIDDVLNGLAPILARQKLCVLPRVIEREAVRLDTVNGEQMNGVVLRAAFDLVSARDGSMHTIEAYGEALDSGDKATSKAMTAAFKGAMIQAFCIPIATDDADATSPRVLRSSKIHEPEPPEGWEAWTDEVTCIVGSCESDEALRRVQETYREKLKGLRLERRGLFESLGAAFASKANSLAEGQKASAAPQTRSIPIASSTKNASLGAQNLADA